MKEPKNIYFASDFHLGIPNYEESLKREKLLVKWLDEIKEQAKEIYFMGDIFDFWFEYRTVVPKGYTRLFGKIAEITDSGIPVHLYKGNHDMWAYDYLSTELGIQMHRNPEIKVFNNKRFYIGHGDGCGPGDHGYKFLKKVFEGKLNQWFFKLIHPNTSFRLALYFSRRSRLASITKGKGTFNGKEGERLYHYCESVLKNDKDIDYFIFGHRHIPLDLEVGEKSKYINIGDWITYFSYVVFDGNEVRIERYNKTSQ